MDTDKQKTSHPDMQQVLAKLIPGVYVIGACVLLAYMIAMFVFGHGFSNDPGKWGVLGDYFGGLMNPVISFATLMVAYAVWKQQREELRQTKEALEDQAKTASQQRREQRFFDLLNIYFRTTESLQFTERSSSSREPTQTFTYRGKEAIQKWLGFFSLLWNFTDIRGNYARSGGDSEEFRSTVSMLRKDWEEKDGINFFGAYLRTIESVLSTAKALFGDSDQEYIDLFKSQLGKSELILIGYFLLLEKDYSAKLMPLVEEYGLLEHLTSGDLRSLLLDALPSSAFLARPDKLSSIPRRPPC